MVLISLNRYLRSLILVFTAQEVNDILRDSPGKAKKKTNHRKGLVGFFSFLPLPPWM